MRTKYHLRVRKEEIYYWRVTGLLAWLLEAQWVAGVQYVLRPSGEPTLPPLQQAFASWWAGVGLDRDAPIPT